MANSAPNDSAAVVQETLDAIVTAFEHPQELELHDRGESGQKRTVISVGDDGTVSYELRFDGSEDDDPTPLQVRE